MNLKSGQNHLLWVLIDIVVVGSESNMEKLWGKL